MMDMPKDCFERLIAPLNYYMLLSRKAYDKYLQNKILLHALNIFAANEKIVETIISNPALIPDELVSDTIELVNHYGIWMNQFRQFRLTKSFELKDEFVFHHIDNLSAFPKEAEKRIFEYHQQLKQELAK